jgi:hypothetical protein
VVRLEVAVTNQDTSASLARLFSAAYDRTGARLAGSVRLAGQDDAPQIATEHTLRAYLDSALSASVDAYRWRGSDWRGTPDNYNYAELRKQRPPNQMPDALRDWLGAHSVGDTTTPLDTETSAELNSLLDAIPSPDERFMALATVIPLLAPLCGIDAAIGLRSDVPRTTVSARKPVQEELEYFLESVCEPQAHTDFVRNTSGPIEERIANHYPQMMHLLIHDAICAGAWNMETWLRAWLGTPQGPCSVRQQLDNSLQGIDRYVNGQLFERTFAEHPQAISRHFETIPEPVRREQLYRRNRDSFESLLDTDDLLFQRVLKVHDAAYLKRYADNDESPRHFSTRDVPILYALPKRRQLPFIEHCYRTAEIVVAPKYGFERFSSEVARWFKAHLDAAQPLRVRMRAEALIIALAKDLPTERMGRLIEQAADPQAFVPFDSLFQAMDRVDWVAPYTMHTNENCRKAAIARYLDLASMHEMSALYPLVDNIHAFCASGIVSSLQFRARDPELMRKIWRALEPEDLRPLRREIADNIFGMTAEKRDAPGDLTAYDTLARECLADDEASVCQWLREKYSLGADQAERLVIFDSGPLRGALMGAIARTLARSNESAESDRVDAKRSLQVVIDIYKESQQVIDSLTPPQLATLLPTLLSVADLTQLTPQIKRALNHSRNDRLIGVVISLLSSRSVEEAKRAGWLDPTSKSYTLIDLPAISQYPPELVGTILTESLPKLGPEAYSQALDVLEAHGHPTPDPYADWSDSDFRKEIDTQPEKLPAQLKPFDFAAIAETIHLNQRDLRWVCWETSKTDAPRVPRSVRAFLERTSEEARRVLAESLFDAWWQKRGLKKFDWVTRFVIEYGDDRLVPTIATTYRKRANNDAARAALLRCLAGIGTTYALYHLYRVSLQGGQEMSTQLQSMAGLARQALFNAAASRGLSYADLVDELVPDLGYTDQGLVMDLDVRTYHARMNAKGTVEVVREDGKKFKSLPKQRSDEDPERYAEAKAQLKGFRAALKDLRTDLSTRLREALLVGRIWRLERWQQMFEENPLMSHLHEGMIWNAHADGESTKSVSFRLHQDGICVDAHGAEVDLSEFATIDLWHPLDAHDAEIEAWREHLRLAKCVQLVDQIQAPVATLAPEEQEQTELTRHRGYTWNRGSFQSLLKKKGFEVGPTCDGGRIYEHTFALPSADLIVVFHHSIITAWFDDTQMAIDRVTFANKGDAIRLDEVPPRLMAWVLDGVETIAREGQGYDEAWASLR